MNRSIPVSSVTSLVVLLTISHSVGRAAPVATVSLEPNPLVQVAGGQIAAFDLYLREFMPDDLGDAIISFGINVAASDAALTDGGIDFSAFDFVIDSGLSGMIGGIVFDGDITDDGRIEYGANVPTESGILASMGDVLLGSLSVVTPNAAGTYAVDLHVDAASPILDGGTFLLIADGSPFGLTVPGDGDLIVIPSALVVVPEPSFTLMTLSALVTMACVIRRRCTGLTA